MTQTMEMALLVAANAEHHSIVELEVAAAVLDRDGDRHDLDQWNARWVLNRAIGRSMGHKAMPWAPLQREVTP